jgi:hypothetical protein
MGAALLELGQLAGALEAFHTAVRAAERLAGSQPVALTSLLTDVGTLLLKGGYPAEASTYFRRVWHHQRETLGDDSLPAARSVDQFAQSWTAMGHTLHPRFAGPARLISGDTAHRPGTHGLRGDVSASGRDGR